jgi:hypothetical protein
MPRRRIPMNINANAIPAPWDGNHEDVPEGPPNAQARNMANNFGLEDANGVEARPPSRDYVSRIEALLQQLKGVGPAANPMNTTALEMQLALYEEIATLAKDKADSLKDDIRLVRGNNANLGGGRKSRRRNRK